MRTLCFGLLAVSIAAASTSCSSSAATQITVGVMSQIIVPKELRSIRITASVGGDIRFCETYPVDDGKTSLPQSLALAPGGDPSRPVTVTVVGFEKSKDDILMAVADDCQTSPVSLSSDTAAHILRRSKQSYAEARNLYVPMPLRYSCFGVECATGETCKGGKCMAPDVDPAALPDFVPEILFGKDSTCFNQDQCLGDAIGPTVIDAGQCIYEVPPGSSVRDVGMNVRAIYEGHGVEVLDLDPVEGFSIPDASKPNRFQLAPGLCHPMMSGRQIVNVNASRTCASKNVYQPLCAGAPRPLSPSRSALYVLLDHEAAMSEYVGASAAPTQALDAVLKVVLGDPVFSTTTSVAIKLVGDQASACTQPPYKTPDTIPTLTGFTDVWKAADPIASFVKSATTIAGLQLAADVALPGAASGLPTMGITNAKALLLVTNRDPTSAGVLCGGSTAAAIAALPAGVRTYVMSLRLSSEPFATTQMRAANVMALAPAATIISAEGPDAMSSQNAVVSGLGSLVGDLAACVYDTPGAIDPLASNLSFGAPPITVPYNASCMSGSSADGWNADATTVRICGASCTSLRTKIQQAAQLTALKNAMAPSQGQQVLVFVRPK
jgi:hypothetical protein